MDIYAQKIDNQSGLPMWSPADGVPVCTHAGLQRNPVAGYDSLGGVIIAWEDFRARLNGPIVDSTASEIYAHRISLADGSCDATWDPNPGGVAVTVNTNAIARDVRIAGSPEGAFIAWTDYRNSNGYPTYSGREVYLQYLLSQTGTWPSGGSWIQSGIRVATQAGSDMQHPDLVLDFSRSGGKYGVMVVYEDNRKGTWQIL
jgi:hypothetical protein